MLPIPAIDIRGGQCVRLLRGDFAAETVFGDPIEFAVELVDQGAPMLHIVDLDAARGSQVTNEGIVREIVDMVGVPVQLGGGIRSRERAAALLDRGIDRVVVGTLAVEDPDAACQLAASFPDQVVIGLDHRTERADGTARRIVAVRGWVESGGVELETALSRLEGAPFAGTVVTDISRDGTLEGPDLEGYGCVLKTTELDVIASGGVGTLDDLVALAQIEVDERRLAGVIIGRALLSGAFTVQEAVFACAP